MVFANTLFIPPQEGDRLEDQWITPKGLVVLIVLGGKTGGESLSIGSDSLHTRSFSPTVPASARERTHSPLLPLAFPPAARSPVAAFSAPDSSSYHSQNSP